MVNIDTVYQTVQALANKEQRGYITPQEFNLFANQAQQDIFEQYFYDLNAFRGARPQEREVGDSVTFLQHKLANTTGVTIVPYDACVYSATNQNWTLPAAKLTGRIHYNDGTQRRELKPTPGHLEELLNLRGSLWHTYSDEIFFFEDSWGTIQVHNMAGPITTGITCESVTGKPGLVYWGYTIVNEKATWNPVTSSNFDLHISEQPDLVAKILKLAGISIENQEIYQAGAQEEGLNTQQENK